MGARRGECGGAPEPQGSGSGRVHQSALPGTQARNGKPKVQLAAEFAPPASTATALAGIAATLGVQFGDRWCTNSSSYGHARLEAGNEGLYADRASGCDRHHRDPRRALAPRTGEGQAAGASNQVFEQSKAVGDNLGALQHG